MPAEWGDPIADPVWQMSSAEQAAVEGLLNRLQPRLAIEIGSAEGAATRHLAARAEEVHSFDLAPPTVELPGNVVLHTGDSHELLPAFLGELAEQGRNVDFVIVDGDHSPTGVRRDIEDLLDSPAVGHTAIVIHDIANERVRSGVDAVRFAAWPKVTHVHLDWLPGQLFREPSLRHELWYGLGLVVVDASAPAQGREEVHHQRYFPAAPLLRDGRKALLAADGPAPDSAPAGVPDRERDLRAELDHALEVAHQHRLRREYIERSASWRLTAPLRRAKDRIGPLRRAWERRRDRG
jgi:hypothetical protein